MIIIHALALLIGFLWDFLTNPPIFYTMVGFALGGTLVLIREKVAR